MYLKQFPLIRLIVPLITGIIIAILIDSDIQIPIYVFLFLLTAISVFAFYHKKIISYKFRWIFGALISLIFILFGFELTQSKTGKFKADYFGNFLNGEQYVMAKLISPIEIKTNS